jgi:hypothetical protein
MTELVQRHRALNSVERKAERHDLFSLLLDANDVDSDITLTDRELLGMVIDCCKPYQNVIFTVLFREHFHVFTGR